MHNVFHVLAFPIRIELIYKFLCRDFQHISYRTGSCSNLSHSLRLFLCLSHSLHATHTVELETESECPVRHSKQSAIWQMQTRKSHNEICQHAMSVETLQLVPPPHSPYYTDHIKKDKQQQLQRGRKITKKIQPSAKGK